MGKTICMEQKVVNSTQRKSYLAKTRTKTRLSIDSNTCPYKNGRMDAGGKIRSDCVLEENKSQVGLVFAVWGT